MKNKKLPSHIVKGIIGGMATFSAMGSYAQNTAMPNIVLIFTDDQGYGDLGCFGSELIKTPNLDSLANQGVKFTNFYVSQAVSSASRAALLTGCYSNRVGITGALMPYSETGIADSEVTLAEMLKEQGYATGIFGKWHLGSKEKFLPLQHGFDEYVGLPYSNDMWPVTYDNKPCEKKSNYPALYLIEGNKQTMPLTSFKDQDSLTTLLTRKAVDFIDRKAEDPFFLYFPHPMPHVPLGVSEKFAGKSEYGKYGDVIMEIDWSVGEIVKALRRNGIEDNTLIIFASDNGPWKNFGDHAGTTGGFREGKGTSWEGGHRVPCIMVWPGEIPEGVTINNLASTIDVFPTLAEITNAKLPENKIDGVNILPLLKGDTLANPRNTFVYYYNDNDLEAIRKDEWKLVFQHNFRSYVGVAPGVNGMPGRYNFGESGLELYNLTSDPFETNDVIDDFPEVVEDLTALADEYRNDLGDYLTGKDGKGRRNPGFTYDIMTSLAHKGVGAKVEIQQPYHLKYSGRGDSALCDGIIARPAFKDRAWQGYHGNDMSVIITFSELTKIDSITIGSLKNENSWIFLPEETEILYSVDGEEYKSFGEICPESEYVEGAGNKMSLTLKDSVRARFLKVTARNRGVCPVGHLGAGNKSWIFFDEIIVQ